MPGELPKAGGPSKPLGNSIIHGREGITLPPPPAAAADPVTDDYFGTKITDSYRWLEDSKSTATRDFIQEQNAYTARYLKQARERPGIVDDLDALEHVSRWSLPIERNGSYFFLKRIAGEDQSSIYVRHTWTGKDQRLVDPTALSRDANTSVTIAAVSRDGGMLCYGVRQGGADETVLHILNVKTGKTLEDELPAGLYRSVNFTPDGKGLYFSRQNREGTLLYEHAFGTRISRDTLIFGHEFRGEELGPIDLFSASITEDWRYLVITITRGVPARRVDIVFRDLTKPNSPFDLIVWGLDSRFSAIHASGGWYVKTDYKAPNGRILKADVGGILPDAWTTVVPESADVIDEFSIVGSKIYVKRLKDVKSEVTAYTLAGKPAGTLDFPGIGTASGVLGRPDQRYGFFSFESYIQPPTLYRLDTATGHRDLFAQPKIPFETAQYDLQQVFYKSKDGTRIPMFIAGKKGSEAGWHGAPADDRLWGLQPEPHPALEPRVGLVDLPGRLVRAAQPPRRRRIRRALARAGHVRKEAKRLRRLVRGRSVPHRQQVHGPAALRYHRALQRRPSHGRIHHPASGAIRRGSLRLSAAGHAALSEVRTGASMDNRIRLRGQ